MKIQTLMVLNLAIQDEKFKIEYLIVRKIIPSTRCTRSPPGSFQCLNRSHQQLRRSQNSYYKTLPNGNWLFPCSVALPMASLSSVASSAASALIHDQKIEIFQEELRTNSPSFAFWSLAALLRKTSKLENDWFSYTYSYPQNKVKEYTKRNFASYLVDPASIKNQAMPFQG